MSKPRVELAFEDPAELKAVLKFIEGLKSVETTVKEDPFRYQRQWQHDKYHNDEAYRNKKNQKSKEYYAQKYAASTEYKAARSAYDKERYRQKKTQPLTNLSDHESAAGLQQWITVGRDN